MNITVIVWGGILMVFLLLEAVTVGLTCIWFALGAAAGLVCALLHAPLWVQIALFAVISAAALVLTRPLARKYVNARRQPTNADRCIGQNALVTEVIDNLRGTGKVKLNGMEWTARSAGDNPIADGSTVTVTGIEGVKLIVQLNA